MDLKVDGGTALDMRTVQRERERERRRLRDRQRRQNMSLEQRERHLARRRRNYQLRRMKAENAKVGEHQTQNLTPCGSHDNVVDLALYNDSGADVSFDGLQIMEKLGSTIDDVAGEEGGRQWPRRLRMHQIRQLARLLHTHASDQNTIANANPSENPSGGSGTKRLRLIHIKRLARVLKSDKKREN